MSLPDPAKEPEAARVLVVDDSPEIVAMLGELLAPRYHVQVATNGARALQLARATPQPDVMLLDVMMPGMDGYEVLAVLRTEPSTRELPVIFVTARDGSGDEAQGLERGAVDYIPKPLVAEVVLARVRTHVELKRTRDRLRQQNADLDAEVARRVSENLLLQDISIFTLAHLAEARDPETGRHLRRTQAYVRALAEALRKSGHHRAVLTDRYLELLAKSAPLHDIGKVGVPDAILLKPGKLTPEEWVEMRKHPLYGYDAIVHAEREAAHEVAFLAVAKEIVRSHHEKWDGTGYPDGLAGDAIPLSARLMALADVFDALTTRRPYKAPVGFDEAARIIEDGSGRHFDPLVVGMFRETRARFEEIARAWVDTDEELDAKQRHAPRERPT